MEKKNGPKIISIRGIPGSGKTHLCKKLSGLRNVTCVDTDDIMQQSLSRSLAVLTEPNAKKLDEEMQKQNNKIRDEIIASCSTPILIFSGITVEPGPTLEAYFITIKEEEFPEIFRRYMERETEKYVKNGDKIRSMIHTEDPRWMAEIIEVTFLFSGRHTFESYKSLYKYASEYEKKQGAKFLSQDEIFQSIVKLAESEPFTSRMDTSQDDLGGLPLIYQTLHDYKIYQGHLI